MTAQQDALAQYEQTKKIEKNKKARAKNTATLAEINKAIADFDKKIADLTPLIESERAKAAKIITDWEAAYPGIPLGTYQKSLVDSALNNAKYYQTSKTDLQRKKKAKIGERDTLVAAQKKLYEAYKILTGKPPSTNQDNKDGTPPGDEKQTKASTTAERGGYTFNAPMVKQASFASPRDNFQKLIANGYNISEGTKDDAFFFWKNGQGGRGTIQMDRQSYTSENRNAKKALFNNPEDIDDNLYGFKFHYNPGLVTMTWGAVDGVDPYFAGSDKDPSNPVGANLLQSYIDFSFYINRIEDYNYLTDNGLRGAEDLVKSFGGDFTALTSLEGQQRLSTQFNAINPYPVIVPNDELVEIYRRGTMYDVDWLFKVMHGGTGFINTKSSLMGKTSDVGWLPYRILELHLGGSLRYRARIASLKVDHIIFNARMVPVLSKVTMTMARYYDGYNTGKVRPTE